MALAGQGLRSEQLDPTAGSQSSHRVVVWRSQHVGSSQGMPGQPHPAPLRAPGLPQEPPHPLRTPQHMSHTPILLLPATPTMNLSRFCCLMTNANQCHCLWQHPQERGGGVYLWFICDTLGITELLKLGKTSRIKSNNQLSPTTMISTKPPGCICLKPQFQH